MSENTLPDLDALPGSALLTRSQVAALTGFTAQALKKWRRDGRGPATTMVEGWPRYRVADVREWLSSGSLRAA